MKTLTLLLFGIFILAMANTAFSQEIEISSFDQSLNQILETIESQTSIGFIVSDDEIDLENASGVETGNYQLDALIEQLSERHQVQFERLEGVWVITSNVEESGPFQEITGRVIDKRTGETLPGA